MSRRNLSNYTSSDLSSGIELDPSLTEFAHYLDAELGPSDSLSLSYKTTKPSPENPLVQKRQHMHVYQSPPSTPVVHSPPLSPPSSQHIVAHNGSVQYFSQPIPIPRTSSFPNTSPPHHTYASSSSGTLSSLSSQAMSVHDYLVQRPTLPPPPQHPPPTPPSHLNTSQTHLHSSYQASPYQPLSPPNSQPLPVAYQKAHPYQQQQQQYNQHPYQTQNQHPYHSQQQQQQQQQNPYHFPQPPSPYAQPSFPVVNSPSPVPHSNQLYKTTSNSSTHSGSSGYYQPPGSPSPYNRQYSQDLSSSVQDLQGTLSNMSLSRSQTSLERPTLHRTASNSSSLSALRRLPNSSRHSFAGSTRAKPIDASTAALLSSIAAEDIPRCYIIAPLVGAPISSAPLQPFRIIAPCQAVCRRESKDHLVHMPEHLGYVINDPEAKLRAHGTVLQHMVNNTLLIASGCDPALGRNISRLADKFVKVVRPNCRVPMAKDTVKETAVESTTLTIEKAMVDHLYMDGIAQLMREVTGSTQAVDWACGLQKIVFPAPGKYMWVCHNCFTGFQTGRLQLDDQQACLDDLFEYPDKSGVKSEARLVNSSAIDLYSTMIKGQGRMKHAAIHLSTTYFEQPERKNTSMFSANQNLIRGMTKTLVEAHLTLVEINGNQIRGSSELMDKDNIYLHLRRIFTCFQIEFLKLTGLPFLLREKLPGFLNHAKYFIFDGVLIDNDKAVANMKKLITSNSDLEHLMLTNAYLTGSGLKVLCGAHKDLRRLTKVDLSSNAIDGEGVKEFASNVLQASLDLRYLDLSNNPNIGSMGSNAVVKVIWPAPSFRPAHKHLVFFQMANTGLGDEAALVLSRGLAECPQSSLFKVDISGNMLTKTGLTAMMDSIGRHADICSTRRVLLSQNSNSSALPGFMSFEVLQLLSENRTLTHISLSKLSLSVVAQIVNMNRSLISLIVDDAVCIGNPQQQQEGNFALSSFNSLCQSISVNDVIQELRIRTGWTSFWTLAYPVVPGMMQDQESVWNAAAGWMSVMESHLERNKVLRCLQMRGVTDFEEELVRMHSHPGGAGAANGGLDGSENGVDPTSGELVMIGLSRGIRGLLEKNQVRYYAEKHGLEVALSEQLL